MDINKLVSVLQTYGGRDKAMRTAHFALVLVIGRMEQSPLLDKLSAIAAQLSTARLIGRRALRNYLRTLNRRIDIEHKDPVECAQLRAVEHDYMLTIIISLADLMNAINGLPKGILWSQTLPVYKKGAYGLIASLLGFYRLYKAA